MQPGEYTYLYFSLPSSCPKIRTYNYSSSLRYIYIARNINLRKYSVDYSVLEAEELLFEHKKPTLTKNRAGETWNYIFRNRKKERIKLIGDKCRL